MEELENQFSKFLDRLYTEFKDKTLDDIKEADSKQIIKTFMRTPALYREIEMVLQATVIGAIKMLKVLQSQSYQNMLYTTAN